MMVKVRMFEFHIKHGYDAHVWGPIGIPSHNDGQQIHIMSFMDNGLMWIQFPNGSCTAVHRSWVEVVEVEFDSDGDPTGKYIAMRTL